jgi:hypothetical protein
MGAGTSGDRPSTSASSGSSPRSASPSPSPSPKPRRSGKAISVGGQIRKLTRQGSRRNLMMGELLGIAATETLLKREPLEHLSPDEAYHQRKRIFIRMLRWKRNDQLAAARQENQLHLSEVDGWGGGVGAPRVWCRGVFGREGKGREGGGGRIACVWWGLWIRVVPQQSPVDLCS